MDAQTKKVWIILGLVALIIFAAYGGVFSSLALIADGREETTDTIGAFTLTSNTRTDGNATECCGKIDAWRNYPDAQGFFYFHDLSVDSSSRIGSDSSTACLRGTWTNYEKVTVLYNYQVGGGGDRSHATQQMSMNGALLDSCTANNAICERVGTHVLTLTPHPDVHKVSFTDGLVTGTFDDDAATCWSFATSYEGHGLMPQKHLLHIQSITATPKTTTTPVPGTNGSAGIFAAIGVWSVILGGAYIFTRRR